MTRIKSRDNRDKRVELLQKYARTQFPAVKYMEYAVTVETYTLTKANNLVLNVDGCIGSLFLDLLSSCSMFTQQEIDEIIEIGYLNGLFVLARSIGLIGYVSSTSYDGCHTIVVWLSFSSLFRILLSGTLNCLLLLAAQAHI